MIAGTSEGGEEGGGQGVDDSAHEGAAAGAETAEHAAIISGAARVSMAGSPLVHAAVQEARRPPPRHPSQHIACRKSTPVVLQLACRERMIDRCAPPKAPQADLMRGLLLHAIPTRVPQAQKQDANRRAERHAVQQQENRHRVPPGNGSASPAPDAAKPRLPLADAWGNVSPPPKQPRGAQLMRRSAAGSCRTSIGRENHMYVSSPPHSKVLPVFARNACSRAQRPPAQAALGLAPHECRCRRRGVITGAQPMNIGMTDTTVASFDRRLLALSKKAAMTRLEAM